MNESTMCRTFRRPIGALYLLALAALLQPARASFAETQEAAIEEVLVTARKREEPLQHVPISVTVLSQADLEIRKLSDISQVAEFTPNMEFDFTAPISGSTNNASVFIRGVGQTDYVPNKDPGVGIYLDGVYIARTVGSVLNLLDVERVEVLRGPQGTLFGKNTVGGAINVITVKPTDDFEAGGDVTLGNYGRADLRGYLNTPISEGLSSRLSFGRFKRDGHVHRIEVGDRLGDDDEWAARLAFRWSAQPSFIADLAVDYSRIDENSTAAVIASTDTRVPTSPFSIGDSRTIFAGQLYNVLIGAPGPCVETDFGCLPPLPATFTPYDRRWLTDSPYETFATGPNGSTQSVLGANATLTWTTPDLRVRSITGSRWTNAYFGRDSDGSPLSIAETEVWVDHEQFSQEFQFMNSADQHRLDWVSGLYYLVEEGKQRDYVPFSDETFQYYASAGIPIPNFVLADGPESVNDIESLAVYAEGSYAMTKRWELTAGARWTDDRRETTANTTSGGVQSVINPQASTDFQDISGRLILSFSPTQSLLTYASYSEGFKSGGFNHRLAVPPPPLPRLETATRFAPEEVQSYEVGFKSELREARLRLNAAAFHSEYDDIQVLVFDLGVPRTINAAAGKIDGLELELQLAASEKWRVDLAYGYLDAQYTRLDEDIPGAFGNPISVVPLTLESQFVNTPEHKIALGTQAQYTLGTGSQIRFRADARYRSEVVNDTLNTPELIQEDLWLFSASVDWRPAACSCQLSLFGENLTDEVYIVSGASDPAAGSAELIVARPRTWGLRLSYHYD